MYLWYTLQVSREKNNRKTARRRKAAKELRAQMDKTIAL
jgi:hypothetical protein